MNIKKAFLVALSLAIVVLFQTPVASAKDAVTRPFRISGQSTFLDFGSTPLTFIDQGVASEIGKFVLVGKYTAPGSGFGMIVAADGDQIFWIENGGVLEFEGGTGRFEGATGGFTVSILSYGFAPGPAETTTVTLIYIGEGTITY